MMKATLFSGVVAVIALLGGQASADSALTEADQKFVTGASAHQLGDIKLGELAVRRGVDPAVKALGRRVIEEDTQGKDEVQKLARREGIALPGQLTDADREAVSRLSRIPRASFDRTFLEVMAARERQAINDFETEAGVGKNDAIRQWAAEKSTILRSQHDLAKESRAHLAE